MSSIYYPNKRYIVSLYELGVGYREHPDSMVTFDEDLGLVVAERPKITPLEVKTEYVEILGRTGDLDLTGAVDGAIHFGPTEVEIKFLVMPNTDAQMVLDMLIVQILGRKLGIMINEAGGKGDKMLSVMGFHNQFGSIGTDAHQVGRVIGLESETDGRLSYITMKFRYDADEGYEPYYFEGLESIFLPTYADDGMIYAGNNADIAQQFRHKVYNEATYDPDDGEMIDVPSPGGDSGGGGSGSGDEYIDVPSPGG